MKEFTFSKLTMEEKHRRVELLSKFKLPNNITFLHCGTLLGSVRENALIEHDDDFDIAYLSNYHTKEEIRKEMLDIYEYLKNNNMLVKYFDTDYKEVFEFDRDIKGLGQAHIKIDNFIVDLWTTWIDEEGYFNLFDMKQIADNIVINRKSKIYDIEFDIPNKSEEILEKIYGSDWKTPRDMKPPCIGQDGKFIQLR